MKYSLFFVPVALCSSFAVSSQEIVPFEQLLSQGEQRQAAIDRDIAPQEDGRVPVVFTPAKLPHGTGSSACFSVQTLRIRSPRNDDVIPDVFTSYLTDTLASEQLAIQQRESGEYTLTTISQHSDRRDVHTVTPCLSATKIQRISTALQNMLVEKGFITSRVLIPNQNLRSGELTLGIAVGHVGDIVADMSDAESTNAQRSRVDLAFPTKRGKPLNLRDLEQGLENLRNVPTVSAEMDIVPGAQAHDSDIVVKWKQRDIPFRINLSIDDSGSDSTGKYLGTVSLSWDTPLRMNDSVNLSYTKNIQRGLAHTDPLGNTDSGNTNNYALSYYIPFGYWKVAAHYSAYRYSQVVAGINRNYEYAGDSRQGSIDISRVMYRDNHHTITAQIGAWFKQSKNYIDDAEVTVQRRQTGGWKARISHRSYFSLGTLNSALTYKRGTRAFGAIAAPEELFDEGTGKMQVWTADIDWNMPFTIGESSFNWQSVFHGQLNGTPLTAQDKISLGGRHSVRGFSGATTLSAERGAYWKNDILWNYKDNHQLYVGLDTGFVDGDSVEYLLGSKLTGAALGVKGSVYKKGRWSYDAFVAVPIDYPEYFPVDSTTAGFNVHYTY